MAKKIRQRIPITEQWDIMTQFRHGASIANICRWHNLTRAKCDAILSKCLISKPRPKTVKEGLRAALRAKGYGPNDDETVWTKRRGSTTYTITFLKNKVEVFERESPLKEGWWTSSFPYSFQHVSRIP